MSHWGHIFPKSREFDVLIWLHGPLDLVYRFSHTWVLCQEIGVSTADNNFRFVSFRPFLSVLLVSPWNKTQGTHLLLLSINVAGCRISNLLLFRHHLLDNASHESYAFWQPCSISDELGCDGQFAWAWLWKIWALLFNLAFTDVSFSELSAVYVSGVNRSWNSWSCNMHICALNWWAFYLNPCTSRVARR
jgi:hypothetical protein